MRRNELHMSMQFVCGGTTISICSWQKCNLPSGLPTLSVSGMACVDIEGLLTLPDGSSQGKICLHHPLLVVAIDDRLWGHGQRVTLGHIFCQGGKWLFGLKEIQTTHANVHIADLRFTTLVSECNVESLAPFKCLCLFTHRPVMHPESYNKFPNVLVHTDMWACLLAHYVVRESGIISLFFSLSFFCEKPLTPGSADNVFSKKRNKQTKESNIKKREE